MNDELKNIWDLENLTGIPEFYDAPGFCEDGVRALFYENVEWRGKPTRAFAWYGCPEGASAEKPVPGIVLVHGGGATALADWVRLWNDRGYAAIAMDNCGGVPAWSVCPYSKPVWPRHQFSGPAGWGNFHLAEEPPRDQWIYHAAASVLRARALLASFPEVQADNIGVNGISWGAVLTCIAIGLEPGFRHAAPVYGCGGFKEPESSICPGNMPELSRRWHELWDPDIYLAGSAVPTLFTAWTNDPCFPLGCWDASARRPKGPVYRSLREDYTHDHTISWQSRTILEFADAFARGGELPKAGEIALDGPEASAAILGGDRRIVGAEFVYTRASGAWADRKWNTAKAELGDGAARASLPPMTTACFFAFMDDFGGRWTTHVREIRTK